MVAISGIILVTLITSILTIGMVGGTAGFMYGVFKAIEYVMDRI